MKSKSKISKLAIAAILILTVAGASRAGIIYVDDDAAGPIHDGTSWATAHKYLQDALVDAAAASKPVEIWVAQGTYKPDEDTGNPTGTGDQTATFQLINEVAIKGGYSGIGAEDPDARDPSTYVTTLSGDLTSNDGPDFTNMGDNSNSVTAGSGTDTTAILDGFTITAGNGSGGGHVQPDR